MNLLRGTGKGFLSLPPTPCIQVSTINTAKMQQCSSIYAFLFLKLYIKLTDISEWLSRKNYVKAMSLNSFNAISVTWQKSQWTIIKNYFLTPSESNLINSPFEILILIKTDSVATQPLVIRFLNPDTNICKLSMCFKLQIFFNP